MAEAAPILDQTAVRTSLAYATGEGDKYYYEIAAPDSEGRNLGTGTARHRSVDIRRPRMARAADARHARIRTGSATRGRRSISWTKTASGESITPPWRRSPSVAPVRRASTSSITRCVTATRKCAARKASRARRGASTNDYTHWSAREARARPFAPTRPMRCSAGRIRHRAGVAPDRASDRVGPHHHRRCTHGGPKRTSFRRRGPRPGRVGRALAGAVQPASPVFLLPAPGRAGRGGVLQGVRLGNRRTGAIHVAHRLRVAGMPGRTPAPRHSVEMRLLAFF